MKKLTMPGQVWYRTKPRQSGIFLVQYWTEIIDTGMPMPALVSWMPVVLYIVMYTGLIAYWRQLLYARPIALELLCTII
jgi:hypothetical protein